MSESRARVMPRAGVCLLLVENDPVAIGSLEQAFLRAPVPVELYVRPNRLSAFEYLASNGNADWETQVSMILLGKSVSVVEGKMFLKSLSATFYRDIPVIVLTESRQTGDLQESYRGSVRAIIGGIDALEGLTSIVDLVVRSWFQVNRDACFG